MTDQKRDESPERYPSIQHDPARRIRRIQRWLGKCGAMIPCALSVWPPLYGGTNHEKLCEIADVLFAVEIDWLCGFADRTSTSSVLYFQQYAVVRNAHRDLLSVTTHQLEKLSLDRVQHADELRFFSEERERYRKTLAEQKARIEELERNLKQCSEEYNDFVNPLRPGDF